jgi:hypothetical protein
LGGAELYILRHGQYLACEMNFEISLKKQTQMAEKERQFPPVEFTLRSGEYGPQNTSIFWQCDSDL